MLSPLSYYLPKSLLSSDKSIIDIIPTLVPKAALPGDTFAHYRCPTVLLGTTGRHFPAIIVAQRCWPDIFTHFTNPSLTQKPRLFTTSLQARTLRRHLSLLSSPNDVHRHSRATLTPIIVAQRYSLALSGDSFAHYRRPRAQT